MSKSLKRKALRQRKAKQDKFLKQLDHLYGNKQIKRDVFGRRAALPSEIARQLEQCPARQTPTQIN